MSKTPEEVLKEYDIEVNAGWDPGALKDFAEALRQAIKERDRKQAQIEILCEEMLGIREALEDVLCCGPCDSYGVCEVCNARTGTYHKELIEQDRLPK